MEEQAMKIPTAAYCRVSTMSDLQDGSYEVQRDYYKKLIESNPDMELVGIYGDHGKSGRTMQTRPQLKKLIRDCEEGKIKLILTKSISRFARNMMECVETIRHLRELGVKVVFEKECLDTESMGGELMLGILATIAQEESNSISQNLNWSRRQHALRGEPWERPPYGYVSVGKQHKWEPVEEQGDVVRQAFYMAGMCYKYPDIVEELNRMEREMGSERVWTHGTLMILLKNCAYIGEYLSNKECAIVQEDGTVKRVKNKGYVDQIRIEDHHEAFVSRELYDAVKTLLELGVLNKCRNNYSAEQETAMRRSMEAAAKEARTWEAQMM